MRPTAVLPLSAEEFNNAPCFNTLKKIGYHRTMTIETTKVNLPWDGAKSVKFVRAAYASADAGASAQ
jgi:hypothetical protein